jgi:hypothetical protein
MGASFGPAFCCKAYVSRLVHDGASPCCNGAVPPNRKLNTPPLCDSREGRGFCYDAGPQSGVTFMLRRRFVAVGLWISCA